MHMPYGVVGYDPGEKLLHRWPDHRCTSFLSSTHFHAYHSANSRQNFGPQLIWSRSGLSVQMMPIWCFELFQGTSSCSRGNGISNGFLQWIDHVWTILNLFFANNFHPTHEVRGCTSYISNFVMHCDCMRRCLYHGKVTIEQLCQIYDRCIVVCALSLWLWETGVIRTKGTKGKRYSRERYMKGEGPCHS